MSVNQNLQNDSIRHQVYLQRYNTGVVNRMLAKLNQADAVLRAQLAERIAKIEARGFDTGPWTTQRLTAQLRAIAAERAATLAAIGKDVDAELLAFAQYESPFLMAMVQTNLPAAVLASVSLTTPSPQQVYASALARPFQGKLLSESLKQLASADALRIRDVVRMGFMNGQTTNQIVGNVMGTPTSTGAVFSTRRGLSAIIRTALQHTASVARQQMLIANSNVIKAVKYSATLDSRTTPLCRALDGRTWKNGSTKIRWPPQHWQCRSQVVYITKSWKELGMEADEMPASTRASMNGQVPEDLTYPMWLKQMDRTNPKVVTEILGPTRAKLWRTGKLPIERFVDLRSGKEYTLKQLRKNESDIWRKTFNN